MNEKKSTRKDVEYADITFAGLQIKDVQEVAGEITIRIPVQPIERFEGGPMFSDAFLDYCQENHISEETLMQTADAFYDEMFRDTVSSYMAEHMRSGPPPHKYPPKR